MVPLRSTLETLSPEAILEVQGNNITVRGHAMVTTEDDSTWQSTIQIGREYVVLRRWLGDRYTRRSGIETAPVLIEGTTFVPLSFIVTRLSAISTESETRGEYHFYRVGSLSRADMIHLLQD